MERLEIIKDTIAISRDILLIIAFVVIIVLGFAMISFVNSIDPSNLSCEGLVGAIMSGDLSILAGGTQSSGTTEVFEPTDEMVTLMGEIETALNTGDKETAVPKLDELKALCSSAGMSDAVLKIEELKMAINEDNYVKVLGLGSQLKQMFGQ